MTPDNLELGSDCRVLHACNSLFARAVEGAAGAVAKLVNSFSRCYTCSVPREQVAETVTNQLRPFNKERFDQCMAFLSAKHGRALTQYDMVKLHVMADAYHLLQYGKPIIGGPVSRWKNGPVVEPAYNRVRRWAYEWDASEAQPEHFRITQKHGNAFLFEATEAVDESWFSKAELASLDKAWQCFMSMTWGQSQDFFHGEATFIGRAWQKAGEEGSPIDWNDVIDAYQELHPEYTNAPHIKALIAL